MMNFDQLVNEVLAREGGYVNHPADRGGPTNFGITLKTLESYRGRAATADDVKAMTKQTAKDIYYHFYWIKPGVNLLPERLQPMVFDLVVNSGRTGVKLLQRALVDFGYSIGVVDGFIGPKTVAAAEHADLAMGNDFVRRLVERRKAFYQDIVDDNPSQRVFLKGWLARANSFLPKEDVA